MSESDEMLPIPNFSGYFATEEGEVWSSKSGQLKKLTPYCVNNHFRLRVNRREYPLPYLILFAFVGPCPEGMECCHNDGNPLNNHVSNLRWDTHLNNMRDRHLHNTYAYGESHHNARLIEADVLAIREDYSHGSANQYELAERYNVSQASICNIINRKTWKHV